MLKTAFTAALLLVCMIANAEARQRHRAVQPVGCVDTDILRPKCGVKDNNPFSGARSISVTMRKVGHLGAAGRTNKTGHKLVVSRQFSAAAREHVQRVAAVAPSIVAHPSGCPSRAFCGCGAAVRIFGHSVRELWLAANWFKFPRAAPAPGMAAVRRHHVFVLEADLGNGVWQVWDANSGGHKTRVHARSIAGYAIVNPHGAG